MAVVTNEILHFRIVDNGIGISKAHIHRIFDMCYRTVEYSKARTLACFW
jgi:signal transduction histidine kinase